MLFHRLIFIAVTGACILAILSLLPGCSSNTLGPPLQKSLTYHKDIKMTVVLWDEQEKDWADEETIYEGVGVLKRAKGYKIKVEPQGKAHLITVTSCHGVKKTPAPKRKGGWFSKKYYEFEIWPSQKDTPRNKECSFDIAVFEKGKGRHGWGLLVIKHPKAVLKVYSECNWEQKEYTGTSICQAKKGLTQSLHFERAVLQAKVKGCELPDSPNGRDWVFPMPGGECPLYFVDKKNSKIFHKAILSGFDEMLVRGLD